MQIAISARDDGGRAGTDDLRGWLGKQRELRGRVQRGAVESPAPGTMGTATEFVTVLLEPGGVVTVLVAAVVTWVQNRSGSQTVTIVRPDGTEVTVTSDRVRGLNAQQAGALAQEIAGQLGVPMQRREPAEHAEREAQAEPGAAPPEPGAVDGTARTPGDGREEPGPDTDPDPDPNTDPNPDPEPGVDGRRP
ncbi:effector-associated constant component EACC1 [Streptomyces sp. 5.8]|uniref:effector-associated constant component EACC1 n=1 Tax=Streptomyces sp. 5.8 TaxID=3406571 RepID=UPI003BB4CCB4